MLWKTKFIVNCSHSIQYLDNLSSTVTIFLSIALVSLAFSLHTFSSFHFSVPHSLILSCCIILLFLLFLAGVSFVVVHCQTKYFRFACNLQLLLLVSVVMRSFCFSAFPGHICIRIALQEGVLQRGEGLFSLFPGFPYDCCFDCCYECCYDRCYGC